MRQVFLVCVVVLAWMGAQCAAPTAAPGSASMASVSSSPSDLRIDGDVPARTLSMHDLEALSPVRVEWTHKGETRSCRAVPLETVLRAVGVDPGSMASGVAPAEKRAGWKFAVVATASDGFQATFSVAELFHGMGPTKAYVAVSENGEPIDPAFGPLRLIVTTDGEGSRSARNLRRLTILDLRRCVSR